jgi:1,4-dihydroxy-2-naphthoate octaprenyltransferase
VGLNFGPLAIAGAVYAITGEFSWQAFLLGIPVGLLTMAILWINQFPDEDADRASGKINLVVVLGKERARWGYLILLASAVGLLCYWAVLGLIPPGAILAIIAIPIGIRASTVLMREYAERSLIQANAATIQLHLIFGITYAVGIAYSIELKQFLTSYFP